MLIEAEALRRLVAAIFAAAGCEAPEAVRIARHLVASNLAGHDSHGVIRVPRYIYWIRQGHVVPNRSVTVVTDSPTIAVLDGGFGFGQSLGEEAVALGIEKARTGGCAVIVLRNAGHLGRIGDWAELAAEAGFISLHFVNTSGLGMLVAPFGGTERRMSTNPIAIGVPTPDGPPLVLDCATSVVAEGKVLVALNGGTPLPEGALIERDGSLSTDPETIYGPLTSSQPLDQRTGSGAIRAMGEHKGSGLAIMCELLAGALSGGGCSRPGVDRLANNMLSVYLDVARFDQGQAFAPELARYVDFVRSARPAEPGGEVLLPGEPEQRARAIREASGVPLTEATWDSLRETAEGLGLDAAALSAAG